MSSGFVTESEAVEARKKKQEEWERVRKADDPLEAPEQAYDHRSLYERLQEQKQKKDLEYEEAHKLKNMIKGLDDDEIEFLDFVDRTKIAADRKKNLEEEKELSDYRNQVASLQEKSLDQKLHTEVSVNKPKFSSNRTSQTKLLKGVIVKSDSKKRKNSENDAEASKKVKEDVVENGEKSEEGKPQECIGASSQKNTGLTCVAILPGLGCYDESSSDDCSSNSEQDSPIQSSARVDLLGRKISKKKDTKKVKRWRRF